MGETIFGFEPVRSVYNNETELLDAMMELHFKDRQFDLDCTYSKGVIWKNFKEPLFKSDLYPKNDSIVKCSSTDLLFSDESMGSVMFDPPFLVGGSTYKDSKKGSTIIAKRFESFNNFEELKEMYYLSLKDIYRVLKNGGKLAFKCQDVVSSGKNHFTHCLIMAMAVELGYYPKDLFVLTAKTRLNSFNGSKWVNQYHARKYHCYYWVFEKVNCKVNYNYERLKNG